MMVKKLPNIIIIRITHVLCVYNNNERMLLILFIGFVAKKIYKLYIGSGGIPILTPYPSQFFINIKLEGK